jgi:hypothetical protein
VEDSDDDDVRIISTILDNSASGGNAKASLKLKFNGEYKMVYCDIDTGSSVCLIGYTKFCQLMKNNTPELKTTKFRLKGSEVQLLMLKVKQLFDVHIRRRFTMSYFKLSM